MKKRMISLLLALVMILGMIPAMVPAASAADVKDEINIIRLVGPKNGRYLDFECGVSLLGVKVDGIRWVDHTAGERYEIEYPGTHEPVEVVAGHEYRVVIFMSTTDGSVFPDPDDITASIPGADSVFAGLVGGEGADTVCVTGYFTATQGDNDIIGVKASGDGYYWNREGEAVLNLNMDSQAFLYDDDSIGPVEGTRMGSLYTDQALTKPATSMEVGEAYYFEYTLWHKSGEVNKVEDYDSSLDFEGFSNGTVIKTTTGGNNNFTMLCSIVYGDMNVDKVEAVGTGYGYDSAEGAYAPIFESIKAYNAAGIEFDYDGFTWSTPFYTKSSFSSANKLTSEPQNGETYYFGIYIDQYLDGMSYGYTGALELMDNSVVTIPGFEVECVGFMEREMGSYLELTYAATKRAPDVYVGGVGMYDGDYLAVGATATQTTKPSGGYAYYKDGTLTLNNYSYEGKGYLYNSSKGWYATVYAEHDLTVELVGTNSLKQTASESEGIRVGVFDSREKLTIQGDGSINVTSTYCGILAWGSITVNGGTVTATGIEKAIQFSTGFTVAEGMKIQASTTVDGELGEYVAENHNSYKKIVVRSASDVYVGGVRMYDGDYLAVGATATQTTKPSGGYAYYKDGKLTLNNYSYEGGGYGFGTVYTNVTDLTIELLGDNTLVQTKSGRDAICADGANLTIGGTGNLTCRGEDHGIWVGGGLTINGGTITAIGNTQAIRYSDSKGFSVADGLTIQASTTVDGALGEYVAANYDSYKKIVIKTPDVYVGGVGMNDGDYLAVGATTTQTTKPSGGYAYYKDGTLTLNNYSYEGEGYKYGSVYARGTNLTIELLGDNTLVQTKSGRDAICTESANLTIGGTGKLTCRGEDHGIWVGGKLTINGGEITAIGNTKAIRYIDSAGFTVAEGLTMQASTTADGALGEYVAANHDSYKKIVIKPVPTHTVTFKVDTTTVATKTVEDGKTVTAPADPTQSGKTFLGWYNGDTKFDFTTPITGDITLTAKWEKIEMPTAPEVTGVTRIAGADRYTTSFLAADQLKAQLGVQKFNTIVVASGTDFADALSGSYLAAVKDAPMLLVRSRNKEINAVKDYIKANLVSGGTVYLLGGPNAVPKTMETGLDGFTVKRLGGATRYATNLLILEEAGVAGKDILVCTGKGFADSLSASAAKQPILLVKDNLDNNQKNFLSKQNGKIYIIGGTGAVSTRIENQLKTYGNITRLGGATRYITSVMVAETFFKNPKAVVLAYSENFPDGLSGGALACGIDAPLILVKGGKDSDASKYTTAQGIKTGYIMGGAGLIPDRVVRKVFSMAAEDTITIIK